MQNGFDYAAELLPQKIKNALKKMPCDTIGNVCEIRLRANRPISLNIGGKYMFLRANSAVSSKNVSDSIVCTAGEIAEAFCAVCNYSVYAYQQDINNGFVTLKNGCRVGVAGSAVSDNSGNVTSVKNITSLNIRIAAQHYGCADMLINRFKNYGLKNTVIVGAPGCGKTTLLRDSVRQLSGGILGEPINVCVVDERYEICADYAENGGFEIGDTCDVLSGYKKSDGVNLAVRSLSPQMIVFDEIGSVEELKSCKNGFNSGVKIMTSVHANGVYEFLQRGVCVDMLNSEIFELFAFMSKEAVGSIEFMTREELKNAAYRSNSYQHNSRDNRIYALKTGGGYSSSAALDSGAY